MDFWATKTRAEREQEEDERLIRPSPAVKPPRRDLRREHVSPDVDPDTDDASDRKDRSRNYKKQGDDAVSRLVERFARRRPGDRIPAKSRETGKTVMVSPESLKENPDKYEPLDKPEEPKGDSGSFRYPGAPADFKPAPKKDPEPDKGPAKTEPGHENDFYYGPPRSRFDDDPKPEEKVEEKAPEPKTEEKVEDEEPEEKAPEQAKPDFYYGPPRSRFDDDPEPEEEAEEDEPEESEPVETEKVPENPEEPAEDSDEDDKAVKAPENPEVPAEDSDEDDADVDPEEDDDDEDTETEDAIEGIVDEAWKANDEPEAEPDLVDQPPEEALGAEPAEGPAEPKTEPEPEAAPAAEAPEPEAQPEQKPAEQVPPKAKKDKKPKKDKKKPAEEEAPAAEEKPPTAAQKAGIPEPKRRPVNSAETEEALSLLVDTFPPGIAADLVAKNMHPDDVHALVQSYEAAKRVDPKQMDDVISKASQFYQPDPENVTPPTSGKNAKGELVSFDQLTPDEQAESTRQHQLKIAAMSLAAKTMLTSKLMGKGKLTGKARIPEKLASTLSGLILTNAPVDQSSAIAAQVFDTVLEQGGSDPISDKSARDLLQQVGKYPAARAAATAFLQANDYAKAKDTFLKGDDESISEWQHPHEILQGLHKAGKYFDGRNALYGVDGSSHPAANYFRNRVLSRLRTLDPKKAKLVASAIPKLEEKEYKERHRKWEAKYQQWAAKDVAHTKQVEDYSNNPLRKKPPGQFTEPEPVEPKPPASMQQPDSSDIWNSFNAQPSAQPGKSEENSAKAPNGEVPLEEGEREEVAQAAEDMVKNPPKLTGKQAGDFTYLVAPVMGSANKNAVYHGVDPYAYGPAAYPGWLQPHQRDIGETDFKLILGMADDWLKSPLLSVAIDGMEPDARYRAALDLAIYDSAYNRAINSTQYNQLLAKLAGVTPPGPGETLQTIRKEAGSFKTETRYLVAFGARALDHEVFAAVQDESFPFTDESGKSRKGGTVAVRVLKTSPLVKTASEGMVPETVIRVDFPAGSEPAALRSIQAAFNRFQVGVEKVTPGYLPKFRASSFSHSPSESTGDSTPMKASQEIRKYAAEVAKTNSKLAFEMLASADRLAEEEKKMPPWLEKKVEDKKDDDKGQQEKKEASVKLVSLKTLIIKQAASIEASQRAPWLPVLQAIKDLG